MTAGNPVGFLPPPRPPLCVPFRWNRRESRLETTAALGQTCLLTSSTKPEIAINSADESTPVAPSIFVAEPELFGALWSTHSVIPGGSASFADGSGMTDTEASILQAKQEVDACRSRLRDLRAMTEEKVGEEGGY